MKSALTLSIVIPVYNEERYIKRCLDAISVQTIAPMEVIVVDNNCKDKTIEIAENYKFVKVVKESRQGRGFARSAGFDAANGDIIGRIDVDSIIAPNWVEVVMKDFADADLAGVSGPGQTNLLLGLPNLYTTFWSRLYFMTTHSIFDANTMWGANMAVTKQAWQKAKPKITLDDQKVHEDQDLSMVILGQGGVIRQNNQMMIKTHGGGYLYWPKFWEYFKRTFKTRRHHIEQETLGKNSPQRIGFVKNLPGAIVGWFFTVVFIIYSLIVWPFFAIGRRLHKRPVQMER